LPYPQPFHASVHHPVERRPQPGDVLTPNDHVLPGLLGVREQRARGYNQSRNISHDCRRRQHRWGLIRPGALSWARIPATVEQASA
jgi:hypothetical protein